MKNKIITLCCLSVLILIFGILFLYQESTKNKLIENAIQEDQQAVGNELALYHVNRFQQGSRYVDGVYVVDIINDKEELIRYIVKIEKGKVVYCEEVQ